MICFAFSFLLGLYDTRVYSRWKAPTQFVALMLPCHFQSLPSRHYRIRSLCLSTQFYSLGKTKNCCLHWLSLFVVFFFKSIQNFQLKFKYICICYHYLNWFVMQLCVFRIKLRNHWLRGISVLWMQKQTTSSSLHPHA